MLIIKKKGTRGRERERYIYRYSKERQRERERQREKVGKPMRRQSGGRRKRGGERWRGRSRSLARLVSQSVLDYVVVWLVLRIYVFNCFLFTFLLHLRRTKF